MKLRTLFISGAAAILMSVSCFAQDINVSLNGTIVNFPNQKPVVVEGRTLIPLRGVFDNMGYSIGWNGNTKTVTLKKDNETIVINIGENKYYLNGNAHTIDVPAQIINGSTMLPLRAIADATGADVLWDAKTKIATIIDSDSAPTSAQYGQVNVNSKQEADYISSYTNLMKDFNTTAMEFINLINQINASGSLDQNKIDSIYNSAKNMYDVSIKSKNSIANLNCPDKYKKLNNATTVYMQSIADTAKLYTDLIDGNLTLEQFEEKLNSVGTDLMLKEAEYRNVFDEAINANS